MPRVRTNDGGHTLSMRAACLLGILALVTSLSASVALPAAALPATIVEQADSRLVLTGGWTSYAVPAMSGGSHIFTKTAGSSVTVAFVGTRLDVLATTGPKYGVASVSLDGGAPANVDLYSADTQVQQTVFSTGDLPDALHTMRITCTGTAGPLAADSFVSLDALAVSGVLTGMPVDQSDHRIAKRGSWPTYEAPVLAGGSYMFTNVVGSEYVAAFNGTRLDLLATVGPKYGIASVSVDGGAAVPVDFYSASTATQRIVYTTGDLPAGRHSVRVVCTGDRNVSASDSYIGLDAALITGTVMQGLIRYEETDPHLGRNGQLNGVVTSGPSGDRHVWAGPSWGAVAVSFVGARLDWIAVVGPDYGIASVSVDGGPAGYVDLYSPTVGVQRTVYSTGDLPYGPHTVTIGWTGRKNPAARGTAVSFDAFDVGGDLVQAAPPARPAFSEFGYPWNSYLVVDKSDLRIYYVVDGALIATYPVAVGKASTPTPSAIWRIGAKYYSSGVYGPRKMRLFRQSGNTFVYTAYNIHGTDTDSSIGTYASHGCIRLHNYDILVLFDMVPLGTMVVTRD
ncbi:MAG: L,D-transpeptidase [Coriobacteriia bacterium]